MGENIAYLGHSAFLTALAAAVVTFGVSAAAALPEWTNKPYHYVLINQDLPGAMKEFGRNLGFPVVLDGQVRGQIRGQIKAQTAGQFLDELAEGNGLNWYFDGAILHVSPSDEFKTQVIELGRLTGDVVLREMKRMGLYDERFSINYSKNAAALRVSGPPSYIEVTREVISTIQPPPVAADDPRVRVFRGRGATVDETVELQAARKREDVQGSQPTNNSPKTTN
ncbi:type III secretion protein [Phyllobacterium myrsinacearum]|uniref:Type III secretion protein C n=1 Tax=Phyllobacterium myrsinacearum TaxID=28101 RepID=A0A839EL59_9HYPH|nr:type III secretion protein C [Phyllobacterium myrsinacearum]